MSETECVLAFCNTVRADLGRKPVAKMRKGYRTNGGECPIANTINFGARKRVWVAEHAVYGDYGGEMIRATVDCVEAFIDAFDVGERLEQFVGVGWVE